MRGTRLRDAQAYKIVRLRGAFDVKMTKQIMIYCAAFLAGAAVWTAIGFFNRLLKKSSIMVFAAILALYVAVTSRTIAR